MYAHGNNNKSRSSTKLWFVYFAKKISYIVVSLIGLVAVGVYMLYGIGTNVFTVLLRIIIADI